MEQILQKVVGEYSWLLVSGIAILLFQNTIREAVDGIMIFLGNDYNEDDVVEVDGDPGRIVRVGMWKTVFFIYHVVDGQIVGGSKLVVANSKLKDLKIEKPLPNLDLSKIVKNKALLWLNAILFYDLSSIKLWKTKDKREKSLDWLKTRKPLRERIKEHNKVTS